MKKSKMAGFVLFVDDFMGGVAGMSNASVGAYIKLLCFQWSNNGIPNDPKKIRRIVGADNEAEFADIWQEIACKFQEDGDFLTNKKLENVRMVSIEQKERYAEAGRLGGRKTQATLKRCLSDASSDAQAMLKRCSSDAKANPNPNPNLKSLIPNNIIRERQHFVPPTLEEVIDYQKEFGGGTDPQRFIDFYSSKGWLVGRAPMKDWKAAYRGTARWEQDKQQSVVDQIKNWVPKEMRQ